MQSYMTGRVDVSLNGVRIPATLLSDDGVVTTLTEMVYEIPTLGGTFRQASGIYEEANVAVNVVLPNMNYLKNLFPDLYQASNDRPTIAGQTTFGGNTCSTRQTGPVVVHYTCDENSDNDIFIPNGQVTATTELTQNASDPVVVAITIQALPSDDHNGAVAILGTGDLDEPTLWNSATEQYEPIASS